MFQQIVYGIIIGINLGEFKPETSESDGEPGSFKFDAHSIGVTLERRTMFNFAGVPVNNSRVLASMFVSRQTRPIRRLERLLPTVLNLMVLLLLLVLT